MRAWHLSAHRSKEPVPALARGWAQTGPKQRLLVPLGVVFLLAGLLWPWLGKLPWGRLPGDISTERENFSFYFPLGTSLLISIVVSLVIWWWRR